MEAKIPKPQSSSTEVAVEDDMINDGKDQLASNRVGRNEPVKIYPI